LALRKIIRTSDFVEGTFARESKIKNFVFSFVFRSLIRTSDFVEGTCARESKIKNFAFSFVFRSLIRTFAEIFMQKRLS